MIEVDFNHVAVQAAYKAIDWSMTSCTSFSYTVKGLLSIDLRQLLKAQRLERVLIKAEAFDFLEHEVAALTEQLESFHGLMIFLSKDSFNKASVAFLHGIGFACSGDERLWAAIYDGKAKTKGIETKGESYGLWLML